MIRIILAGEGRNELGSYWVEEAFRPERPEPGVLELEEAGVRAKDTPAMVALVERCGLAGIPSDAASLRRWLARAEAALRTAAPP